MMKEVRKMTEEELVVNLNVAKGLAIKYKKAIDIIKLLYISVYEEKEKNKSIYELYCTGKGVYISQEEYELLKEVLGQ